MTYRNETFSDLRISPKNAVAGHNDVGIADVELVTNFRRAMPKNQIKHWGKSLNFVSPHRHNRGRSDNQVKALVLRPRGS